MDAVEVSLWQDYNQSHSTAARNALIEWYMPWMRTVAFSVFRKLPACGLDQGDLESDAVFGMVTAIERFDITRGLNFTTFATPRIRGAIVDALRSRDWVPRLERDLAKQDGRNITRQHSLSDDDSPGKWDGQRSLRVFDDYDRSGDAWWADVCRGLSQRERLILMLYWREELPMREIGEHVGVSESRVSQIMSGLLPRIRDKMSNQELRMERKAPQATNCSGLRNIIAELLCEFDSWIKSGNPLMPPRVWGLAQDADEAGVRCSPHDFPLSIAVGQFNENLRQWSESRPGTTQPDGMPGPRLIASAKLMRERSVALPEVIDDEDESPSPIKPIQRSLPLSTGTNGNRLTNILGMLSSVKVEEIDQEIEGLQKKIDEMKRLRGIVDPTQAVATGQRTRRTAEEKAKLQEQVHAHLKEHGPLKIAGVSRTFGIAWQDAKTILSDKKRFKPQTDGTYAAV